MIRRNLALIVITSISVVSATIFLWLNLISQTPREGFLEGEVRIGPICPVEKKGEPCKTPPEVYEARKIIVYDEDGRRIAIVDIEPVSSGDGWGRYRVELEPGIYIIDINRLGIDSSNDVPTKINIRSGETIKFNIDIDTGIR